MRSPNPSAEATAVQPPKLWAATRNLPKPVGFRFSRCHFRVMAATVGAKYLGKIFIDREVNVGIDQVGCHRRPATPAGPRPRGSTAARFHSPGRNFRACCSAPCPRSRCARRDAPARRLGSRCRPPALGCRRKRPRPTRSACCFRPSAKHTTPRCAHPRRLPPPPLRLRR